MAKPASNTRILEIQSLRGIAIAMVMVFHFSVRWDGVDNGSANLYPFKPVSGALHPLLAQGRLGVHLFFLISGFVIALTLENSTGIGDFWKRRFARLWPPLLVTLPLVWFVAQYSAPLQGVNKSLWALFESFTLINPLILGMGSIGQVTGVLWTLWVELQFYAIASILYFKFQSLTRGLLAGTFLGLVVYGLVNTRFGLPVSILFQFSNIAIYLPWFTAGVLAFKIRTKSGTKLWFAFGACFLASNIEIGTPVKIFPFWSASLVCVLVNCLIFGVFTLAALKTTKTKWLTTWPFLFLGEISYELYLIHEPLGMGFLQWLRSYSSLSGYWLAVTTAIALVPLAWLIYRWWSVPAMRTVRRWLVRRRA